MTQSLRVAVGQMTARLHDTQNNVTEACRLSAEAAAQGARLILLPEGCLTGNAILDPSRQATLPLEPPPFAAIQAVADESGITICPGFVAPEGELFNLVQAIIRPHEAILFQRKATRYGGEPEFLTAWPDATRQCFEVEGVRVAVVICSEWGAAPVEASLTKAAPQILLHSSAGKLQRHELVAEDAAEATIEAFHEEQRKVVEIAATDVAHRGIPKLAANPIGFDGEEWWPGNSYVIDGNGSILLNLRAEGRPSDMTASVGAVDLPIS
jgi:predicted amidohydrolase